MALLYLSFLKITNLILLYQREMLYFLDITICEDVIPIFFAKVTSTPQLLLIFLHLIPSGRAIMYLHLFQ